MNAATSGNDGGVVETSSSGNYALQLGKALNCLGRWLFVTLYDVYYVK